MKTVLCLALAVFVTPPAAMAQTTAAAMPTEPIGAIVNAFKTHDIVMLSDPHGRMPMQTFLLSLIRDPRLADSVNDIVVEPASARYQDVVDRFVRGDDVSETH
jgi:hypothetical protein